MALLSGILTNVNMDKLETRDIFVEFVYSLFYTSLNPYSAGTDYIRFLHFFITTLPISFDNIERKTWHQSERFENGWPPFY